MDCFDYVSSLAAAAVYEHANKFYESQRLLNILYQLKYSAKFDTNKPCLPRDYIDNLSKEEQDEAITELKKQIGSMEDTPACDMLRELNWHSLDDWSSVKLGIGVERGFYAVPFFHKSGDTSEVIIAFRGSDNVFNWVDNLREFSAIDLWPDMTSTLKVLKEKAISDISISAMETTVSISVIAKDYTENLKQRLKSQEVQLRFAGHSLGGYLSLCESLRTRLPATVFENPGFRSELNDADYQYCQRNIREFLSEPNAINSMGHHAGQMFLVPMNSSTKEYYVGGQVYRKDVEKFGPISLRTPQLDIPIHFVARSLNPIDKSFMLGRLNKQVTDFGYKAGIVGVSALALCMFSDWYFSTNMTTQFIKHAASLTYNGVSQLMNSFVEQGAEYLPHYLPFLTDTAESHGMKDMIRRAFNSSGVVQNAFIVLYQGKQACWPQANTKGCTLTLSRVNLNYALTGKALAVVCNSGDQLYVVIKKTYTALCEEREKRNKLIQENRLQLVANQNRLVEVNQQLSLHQSEIEGFSNRLKELEKTLFAASKSKAIAEKNYENGQGKFMPTSRRLEQLRITYETEEKIVIQIESEIASVKEQLVKHENDKKEIISKKTKCERINAELERNIRGAEKDLQKFPSYIDDMKVVRDYLREQASERGFRRDIVVLDAAILCTFMRPPRKVDGDALSKSPERALTR